MSTSSSLTALKMYIRNEPKEKSTKIRMNHLFGHRLQTSVADRLSPLPPSSNPNSEPGITLLDSTHQHQAFNPLIQIAGDEPDPATADDAISLEDLFNLGDKGWVNRYNGYANQRLAEELSLGELLYQDAATNEGAEVDVN